MDTALAAQPEWMTYLQDPIALVALGVLLLIAYRLSGLHRRRQRRQRARLRVEARHAENPRERRDLMLAWNELGGLRELRRGAEARSAREEGQKARAAGRPRTANPYGLGLWGKARRWRLGWKAVDRNIRWIHRHR